MRLLPPRLSRRVPGPELMDDFESLRGPELVEALAELRTINRRLGGLATTRRALDDLAARVDLATSTGGRALEVVDIGGGSGDAAPAIVEWGRSRGIDVRVTVVDLHAQTVDVARTRLAGRPGVEVRQGDLMELPEDSCDVVHAALFLHHFDGDDAVRALAAMRRAARLGVVVNDLRRHWLPWVLIRLVTLVGTRNRLIRHDGPLSVARAFTARDWEDLGARSGLALAARRTWAFRWAVSGVAR